MKRRDLWIASAIALTAVLVLLLVKPDYSVKTSGPLPALSTADVLKGEAVSHDGQNEEGIGSVPKPSLTPAKCYLLVTVGDVIFEPYPLLEEKDFPIIQVDSRENVVRITPNGFYMASGTCSNQECVHQGMVTLENRDLRILGNQVICLPNQVMLELLTPDEAAVVWGNGYDSKK